MNLENTIELMENKKLTQREKAVLVSLLHPECGSLQSLLCIYDSKGHIGDSTLFGAMDTLIKLAQKDIVVFDWLDNSLLIKWGDENREIKIIGG